MEASITRDISSLWVSKGFSLVLAVFVSMMMAVMAMMMMAVMSMMLITIMVVMMMTTMAEMMVSIAPVAPVTSITTIVLMAFIVAASDDIIQVKGRLGISLGKDLTESLRGKITLDKIF